MLNAVRLCVLLAFTVTLNAVTNDPAAALAAARQQIEKRQFSDAAALLERAIVDASTISDAALRNQALAALRFYAAVAYVGMKDEAKATPHLEHYLRVTSSARLDPAKYDPEFVALFTRLGGAQKKEGEGDSFSSLYPGFRTFVAPADQERLRGTWGDSPAMDLLATREEKRQWSDLQSADEREKFITSFWNRRDPTPETPANEFRAAFERRAAFADQVFGSRTIRGTSDDRGKVFVLLGEPVFVRRRPISSSDRVQLAYRATMVSGTIEQWIYDRDQLPVRLNKPQVSYRFVNQHGIGDHVLQRQEDAFAMQALAEAGKPRSAASAPND